MKNKHRLSLLFGDPGTPRDWILSLWCDKYVVRGPRFALREDGTLYDLDSATGNGTKIVEDNTTNESKAARLALEAVIKRLGL